MDMFGGKAAPKDFMAYMMSKQKHQPTPYSRASIKPPFRYSKVDNPSVFIQKKYGDEPTKPFDYCKAQQRREARKAEEEDKVAQIMKAEDLNIDDAVRRYKEYEDLRKEVFKPEWWGLRREDFTEQNGRLITSDGLVFPPVEWRDKATGRKYWALRYVKPLDRERQSEVLPKNKQYTMLFFKQGYEPDDLPSNFSMKTVYKRSKGEPRGTARTVTSYIVETEKKKRGVTLAGTNLTKAVPHDVAKETARKSGKVKSGEELGAKQRRKQVDISRRTREEIRDALEE